MKKMTDLGVEPKPETLWWTSTHKAEDGVTWKVGSRGISWEMPAWEGHSGDRENAEERDGKLVEGCAHLSC